MFYSKRHYAQFTRSADTEAEIAAREKRNELFRQARNETVSKFPVLTPDNVRDVLAYQDARIAELTAK